MYNTAKTSLTSWNDRTSDREKIQHVYIAVAITALLAAGIFGLANQTLGRQVLTIAIIAGAAFLVNALAWALLQSFVLFKLETKPSKKKVMAKKPVKSVAKTTRKKKN